MSDTQSSDIQRFIVAQDSSFSGYTQALQEIRNGMKTSHWIWYVFPQLRGLGHSINSRYYGIANLAEARLYFQHPILRQRLTEISRALLTHKDKNITKIFGGIDAVKLCSCMTLFNHISPNDIFAEILKTFFNNHHDAKTSDMLKKSEM